jgi:branched-chain amino acid transport system substrate-binding protein
MRQAFLQKYAKKMREMPINGFMTKNGRILEAGRVLRNFYLFEVKKPSESKGLRNYYKLIRPCRRSNRPACCRRATVRPSKQ